MKLEISSLRSLAIAVVRIPLLLKSWSNVGATLQLGCMTRKASIICKVERT